MAWSCNASVSRPGLQVGRLEAALASRPQWRVRTCPRPPGVSALRLAQCRAGIKRPRLCAPARGTAAQSSIAEQLVQGGIRQLNPDECGELGEKIEALAAEVKEQLEGTSVYLVGMMGSGKSTVGRMLGGALKYPFLDTDSLIEASAGCTIPQIFEREGEESFRELETQVLQELMPFKEVVVATGGGAVVRQVNWGYLQHGIVVWLSGAPELLARRALRDGVAQRPMLAAAADGTQGAGGEYEAMVARVRGLLEQRGPCYAAADLHVSLAADPGGAADAGAPAAVVTWRLLQALNERLKVDAAAQTAAREAEVTLTDEGLPAGMRVGPPNEAAPAA